MAGRAHRPARCSTTRPSFQSATAPRAAPAGSWTPQHWAGAFTDPSLPAGFAPFGIQRIGGWIYVAYAMQDADAEDEIAGPGLGYVDIYTTAGALVRRFASGGTLNAPWGLSKDPANFGNFH